LELNIPIPDNDIVVAVDSTGMKVTSRGDWMRERHGVERKGWIKAHVAVDVETRRPITFEITDERITDQEMVKPLLKDIKLKDALMDGAYDKEDVFGLMKEKGVAMPGIKIRKNAVVKLLRHLIIVNMGCYFYYPQEKSNVAAADPAASRRGMFPPPHKAGSSKLIRS
jgi:hypothetical protein